MPCLVSHKGREGRKGEARRLLVDPAAMAQGRSHGLIQSPSALAKTRHKPRSNARQMVGFDHVENFPGSRGVEGSRLQTTPHGPAWYFLLHPMSHCRLAKRGEARAS